MALKLMYLTNRPEIAEIAEQSGVDRIFLDLEIRGKEERQGHLDTVISHNSIEDTAKLKSVLKTAELLVRVNSVFDGTEAEVKRVIDDGADIVMLPYFKTAEEVKCFVKAVGGRARTCLLLETPESVEIIDDILEIDGIDEIHIGLNDLHLGYKMKFMFQLVADGTVERLCKKIGSKGIFYGFGGVGRVGNSAEVPLPAENIITEHYRLSSKMVILSRAFCDLKKNTDIDSIREVFKTGVSDFREFEKKVSAYTPEQYLESHLDTVNRVNTIIGR